MTDPLTAEERVTLNALMRKQAEYEATMRRNLGDICREHFCPSENYLDEILLALMSDADRFVAAIKPFMKAPK